MQRRSDKYQYELYALGNRFALTSNRRYDKAMMFFLENFIELYGWARARDPRLALPHVLEPDKVKGLSIKLQFNSEEAWAEAVAALLENLACFMRWVGSVSPTIFIDL